MTMQHRQMLCLAQPDLEPEANKEKKIDTHLLVPEIQKLRREASMLLVNRTSPLFSDGTFIDIGLDEGLYAEFFVDSKSAKKIALDATKYEELCVIAPSGF